jgi:hypothetical protein
VKQRPRINAGMLVMLAAVAGSALVACDGDGSSTGRSAGQPATSQDASGCPPEEGPTTEIGAAKLIIEYNFTDQDAGVHGAFDADGWRVLCVFDPDGRQVLEVGPRGQLQDLSMGAIFFESREPPRSEFSFSDLQAAFPEGQYSVRAESYDGKILAGEATFTHDVPAAPEITSPGLAEEPEGTGANPIAPDDLVVTWDEVAETLDGEPVDITGYEVIVTKEDAEDPNGFSQPIYDVHVPPAASQLSVPPEFLEADTVYELEVLALEVSGNQTISVGFFKTA